MAKVVIHQLLDQTLLHLHLTVVDTAEASGEANPEVMVVPEEVSVVKVMKVVLLLKKEKMVPHHLMVVAVELLEPEAVNQEKLVVPVMRYLFQDLLFIMPEAAGVVDIFTLTTQDQVDLEGAEMEALDKETLVDQELTDSAVEAEDLLEILHQAKVDAEDLE